MLCCGSDDRVRCARLVAAEGVAAEGSFGGMADRISVAPALVAAEWVQGAHRWSGGGGRNWSGGGGRNWSGGGGRNWSGRNWNGRNWNGRMVIGMVVTGTATGGVITSSLSATSGFPTGGAGVGAAIRTDTTVTVIPTIIMAPAMAAMATAATEMMVMDMITVRYGDSSRSRVAELQRRLSRAGYYRGSIDGVLGPQTRRAIRNYEREHGNVG